MDKTTIVTAYLETKSKHGHSKYLEWMQNFLKLDAKLVVFTNRPNLILALRNDRIRVIETDFPDFYTYRYLESWKKHLGLDHEKKIHNINLYMLWNEKSHFLKRAIDQDPFQSEYFYWMDIGIIREARLVNRYRQLPTKVTDRILVLNIQDFTPGEQKEPHRYDNRFQRKNRIGGGVFGGHRDKVSEWHRIYYQTLSGFIQKDIFAGKDQSIMAFVVLNHPELVRVVKPQKYDGDPWFYLLEFLSGL